MRIGRLLVLSAIVSTLAVEACAPSREKTPSAASAGSQTELSFAQQAAAVKAGTADQIRLNETPVSDEDLAQLKGLANDLQRLNLSQTTITDAGLAKIAAMHKLVQLRLASPNLTDAGLASLAQLKELKHLHLIDAPLTDAGLEQLHALANLSSLYLDNTRATAEGMSRLVEALPKVHLHFDGGHFHDDPQSGHAPH